MTKLLPLFLPRLVLRAGAQFCMMASSEQVSGVFVLHVQYVNSASDSRSSGQNPVYRESSTVSSILQNITHIQSMIFPKHY